ncbi:DnaJ domain protein [Gregarina niphandrodes]|uniref:DnaJ domain protein n=1 Tax=Gregarina niphandrodes TaxID=110365 RepID=A0A023B175_GRENI|nr:DnaJ domain protein [Gregarina niphandrodes]EZG46815.1 DnaJ domain protein [Gregarina niphandrodes]|eukprot:XP_011132239.1 DnaJ domain protein [Gregarina niphandrodes]
MPVLALPAIPASYGGIYIGSYSTIVGRPVCETAGRAFFEVYERKHLLPSQGSVDSPVAPDSNSSAAAEETEAERKRKNYRENSSIAMRVRQALEDRADLYQLCCVSPYASAEDIKKQFRKLALIFHPDKSAGAPSVNADQVGIEGLPDVSKMTADDLHEHFLKVHNAFEILSDQAMRRQYDSHLPFDDRLPSELDISTAPDFFGICGPAFDKESRWCVGQPPALGDMQTPLEEVKEFYKFWSNYESWRDFSNATEFNLEEAQDKEEKKWMQKENWKVVKGLLKAERQRVLKFVTTAEAQDPRLKEAREKARVAKLEASMKKMTPAQRARLQAEEKVKAARAKAKALQDQKALIMKRRTILVESKKTIRVAYNKWIVEKQQKSDDVENKVEQLLALDAPDQLEEIAFKLNSTIKSFKEPCDAGARELKEILLAAPLNPST